MNVRTPNAKGAGAHKTRGAGLEPLVKKGFNCYPRTNSNSLIMLDHNFWSDGDSLWTLAVLVVIIVCHLLSSSFIVRSRFAGGGGGVFEMKFQPDRRPTPPVLKTAIVSNSDLRNLMENLDENSPAHASVVWENVIDRNTSSVAYRASCCKTMDGGPLKYMSVTTFEDCPVDLLLNFYMDNHYRMQWDKTVVHHEQLQMDQSTGTEIGRSIKKFTFLTPREYVLAWRLWQGTDGSYYCFTKECEHPLAPREPKRGLRVEVYRSGWRITKVRGRNASEIRMVHQEDAGFNIDFAKLAFAKGIWSYVCKMNDALRRYSAAKPLYLNLTTLDATMSIQKVPPEVEVINDTMSSEVGPEKLINSQKGAHKSNMKKLTRRPSNKLIAHGLIIIGGAICLSRGHSSVGAKVVMSYVVGKLTKHHSSLSQTGKH